MRKGFVIMMFSASVTSSFAADTDKQNNTSLPRINFSMEYVEKEETNKEGQIKSKQLKSEGGSGGGSSGGSGSGGFNVLDWFKSFFS